MQALCQSCGEWWDVGLRSRYCALCGIKYDIDIASLVERGNKAEDMASVVSNRYIKSMIFIGAAAACIPLVFSALGFAGSPVLIDIMLGGFILVTCLGWFGLFAYWRWRRKVLHPMFPDVFANSRWNW